MSGLIKKILVSLAIIFVIFQPVLTPVAFAVGPWEGDTWEGNPWEGDSWEGNDTQWSGDTWSGDTWEGNSWDGDSLLWSGNPWEGKSWEGNSTNGNGTDGNGTEGNVTDGNGTDGNGTEGNVTDGNGTDGDGTEGNVTDGNGTDSDGAEGNVTDGNETEGNGAKENGTPGNGTDNDVGLEEYSKLPYEYNVGKYIVNDVVMGQAKLMGDYQTYMKMKDLGYNPKFNYGGRFYSNILMNGVKLGVGNNAINSMYDTYTHVADGVKGVQDFRTARQFASTTDTLADAARTADNFTPPAASVGALSKLNVAAAVVGTGVSAFETGYKGAKAYDVLTSDASGAEKTSAVADATASLGNTLMNAGVVASAIPGGQAIGAGMVAVGAGVWVVSKGVKLFADNWKGNLWDTGKHLAKKAGNAIKDVASSAWDTVTGWF
ncbi:hypothetical protein [Virgibacillus siamensis]|uniref:hypothetical protein n=1 Tax=Virgibacillus siamensis TaxID=480071 RepID=UPI0009860B0C|nr:hypothetical protein [Virgibacillus siamensis]